MSAPLASLTALGQAVLDLLFPPRCQVCQAFQPLPLCPACRAAIQPIGPPICRICGAPLAGTNAGDRCADCRRDRFHFHTARSVAKFEGTLRDAIHALKYDGRTRLAEPLGLLLVECLRDPTQKWPATSYDCLVPVPLHPRRYRQRGFNQSELLAAVMARELQLPVATRALVRSRETPDQIGLTARQREENVRGAFAAGEHSLRDQSVLVLDDMYTTGATLNECARTLRRAGAARVTGLTLARAV